MESVPAITWNTHAKALTDDPRLPAAARKALEQAGRVAVSVISLCEIGQKVRLGKWPEMAPHVASLERRARDDGFDLIALTATAALEAAVMDWDHRDLFDRMIATVARHEDLPVISSDSAFDGLQMRRVWG